MASLQISPQASAKEIKDWIVSLDVNKDGVITKEELEQGLGSLKKKDGVMTQQEVEQASRFALSSADLNKSGAIDTEEEMNELFKFAQQHWGQLIRAT